MCVAMPACMLARRVRAPSIVIALLLVGVWRTVRAQGPTPAANLGTAPSASGIGSKASADTSALAQFKNEIEYLPKPAGEQVTFSLEDADLPELVKVMGQLTGRRFIFGGKVRAIKATVYCPQKISVAEAYQAFLAILETNGLTVIPHGKFQEIIETPGVATSVTPIYGPGAATPVEDRFVTRLHRLRYVTAEDAANVLGHFKSKDGDITFYSPGGLLIMTDTGTNLKRMMTIVEELDVTGIADQVWVEPVHYADAGELATKIGEILEVPKVAAGAPATKTAGIQGSESRITKLVADDRTNALIVIGTEKAYVRVIELLKRFDVPLTGEGQIHVLPLQHADAEELSKTLNDLTNKAAAAPTAKPGSPSPAVFEGTIRIGADKSTNSLLITSSLRDYASLRTVIDRLDQARRQVFLEAVIMEVSTNHTDKFGVSFHGGDALTDETSILGGSNALGSALFPGDAASLQGLALGVRSNQLISLAGLGTSVPAFGIALQALTTSGDSNVLSTPHILATDNIPAEINVGENVPTSSSVSLGLPGTTGASTANPAFSTAGFPQGSITRTAVGTKVKLVPHLNDSNEVRLEIDETISELGAGQGTTLPTIVERSAKTQVIVQDQQTIVIGGLVRDYVSSEETKVPFLGDIPLIGALFKQSKKQSQKRNLLLILTPYVIRDPADLRAIFERKMQERQEFLDRYFVFAAEQGKYEPNVDYTRTHGLVEEIRQAYLKLDEQQALLDASAKKDVIPHEPGKPIGEVPSPVKNAPAPAPPPPPNPAPVTNAPTILKPGVPAMKSAIIGS
jgi:general secretion pathway protein D